MQLDELRVNSEYATRLVSEYKEGTKDDSTPIIDKRHIRTHELLEKLKTNITTKKEYRVDHLFPPNCRYYEQYQNGHLVIIEEAPAFRTIAVDKDMSNEIESLKSSGKLKEYGYENWSKENPTRPYMFNLAIPYAVFFLTFNQNYEHLSGSVFFRSQAISGFNDPLCKAPFLNINDNQNVCFGDNVYKGPKRSIFSDTNHLIGTFWSAIFNTDYIYNYVAYQNVAGLCDYLTWQHYSDIDPMFVYTADWIPTDKTVGSMVEQCRGHILNRREEEQMRFDYNRLARLFDEGRVIGPEKVPGIDIEEPLIYDVCQYRYFGDIPVYVGDSFKDKNNRLCFIDSYLGFRKMSEPSFINIKREDGKLYRMTLTRECRTFIENAIRDERFESSFKLSNGLVVRPGDIVIMKNMYDHNVYKKVKYIRQTATGSLEARLGSEFYFVDSIPEDTEILDMQNPEYNGIKLNSEDEYFLIRHTSSRGPNMSVRFCKYKEITTNSRGNLMIKFIQTQGRNVGEEYMVNYSGREQQQIFLVEGTRKLPEVFRIGNKLMYARMGGRNSDGDYDVGETYAIDGQGIAHPSNTSLRSAPYHLYKRKLLVDDTLKIESWDLDLEFKIGDKVVIADWENPTNMLTVKQISGWVEDTSEGTISALLTDKDGNQTTHLYVNARHSIVYIGTMRKITNKWEDVSAGTKIIAEEAGIPMFPKKDCNIIIGFIYDTGGPEPMALCSNACTLWYSDVVEKFKQIPISDPEWSKTKHAPINPGKIRIQSGDLLNGRNYYESTYGYLAFRPDGSRTLRALQMNYYTNYMESYAFDRQFSRDIKFSCILNPRLTVSQENTLGFVSGFPNFHGMITKTDRYVSSYRFANEPRSILNVPNSGE